MRRQSLLVLLVACAATGCFASFSVRDYPTSTELYTAGMAKFREKKWNDAALAFERLTLDLPTRDTLLPLAQWYLGKARLARDERLLAAQAFIRLTETLPDDSLADDALLASGRAYGSLWKEASLDPQYGLLAQTQFRLLQGVYPNSTLLDTATNELQRLDEQFAAKDYETGSHYMRRKAFDSAILYFKDVVRNWPTSDKARQAMLRMVEIYRQPLLNYKEDAAEMCDALRAAFPTDREVMTTCLLPTSDSTSMTAALP